MRSKRERERESFFGNKLIFIGDNIYHHHRRTESVWDRSRERERVGLKACGRERGEERRGALSGLMAVSQVCKRFRLTWRRQRQSHKSCHYWDFSASPKSTKKEKASALTSPPICPLHLYGLYFTKVVPWKSLVPFPRETQLTIAPIEFGNKAHPYRMPLTPESISTDLKKMGCAFCFQVDAKWKLRMSISV